MQVLKRLILILTLCLSIFLCRSQERCLYIGHTFLKSGIKKDILFNGRPRKSDFTVYENKYYDCCQDSSYRIDFLYEIDTSKYILFYSLPDEEKIARINLSIDTYLKHLDKLSSKKTKIDNAKKAEFIEFNYSPMIYEFSQIWEKAKHPEILDKIFNVRLRDKWTKDLSTALSLSKMYIKNPNEFARQLKLSNSDKTIINSPLLKDLETYLEVAYQNEADKQRKTREMLKKFKELFK
jgi:hypothetical protein